MNQIQPDLGSDLHGLDSEILDGLAVLYLREPLPALLEAAVSLFPELGSPGETSPEAALRDYHDLFFVPVSGRYLAPFESVQREGRLGGPLTHGVASIYRLTEFDPRALDVSPHWLYQDLPDHIGFELAFISALLRNTQELSDAEAEPFIYTARYFWHHHLSRWGHAFGERLADRAATPFYRGLGRLTASLE